MSRAEDLPVATRTVPLTLTRAEVRADVLEARADGELIPAGENDEGEFRPVAQVKTPKFITVMRAEIAHVLASR